MKTLLMIIAILVLSTVCFGQAKPVLMSQVREDSKLAVSYVSIPINTKEIETFRAKAKPIAKYYADIAIEVDGVEYGMTLDEFKSRITDGFPAVGLAPVERRKEGEFSAYAVMIIVHIKDVERYRVTSRKFKPDHYTDILVIIDNVKHEFTVDEFKRRIVGN